MSRTSPPARSAHPASDRSRRHTLARSAILAAVIDGGLVLVFVFIGRSSHQERISALGTLTTWWPFLAGLAMGWLVTRAWKRPLSAVVPGIPIWVITVAGGMLLRVVSHQGIDISFVLVATIVLGVFLVGWRAVSVLLLRRLRADRS